MARRRLRAATNVKCRLISACQTSALPGPLRIELVALDGPLGVVVDERGPIEVAVRGRADLGQGLTAGTGQLRVTLVGSLSLGGLGLPSGLPFGYLLGFEAFRVSRREHVSHLRIRGRLGSLAECCGPLGEVADPTLQPEGARSPRRRPTVPGPGRRGTFVAALVHLLELPA